MAEHEKEANGGAPSPFGTVKSIGYSYPQPGVCRFVVQYQLAIHPIVIDIPSPILGAAFATGLLMQLALAGVNVAIPHLEVQPGQSPERVTA